MTKQETKQITKPIATRMTARDIQPRGNEEARQKAVIRGTAMARHLNSN